MTEGNKPTIGDVAELRAFARLVKGDYGNTYDVNYVREVVCALLGDELPCALVDVLAICCDPDFIEDLTSRAIADYHAKGEL